MNYDLPMSLDVCGVDYEIRSDFRAVLDICAALNDPDLGDNDRGYVVLSIFYPAFSEDGEGESMPQEHYDEAIRSCLWFIRCGDDEPSKKEAKLMDWEQDYSLVIPPINRVAGCEVRSLPYMHWWTFIGYYREIGDCLFSQIVSIRSKKAKKKKLDKSEQEFYRQNREIIELKTTYAEAETNLLSKWGAK